MSAKKRKKQYQKKARAAITLLCMAGLLLILLISSGTDLPKMLEEIWNSLGSGQSSAALHVAELVPEGSPNLLLYVIDTGNSDSMLLLSPDDHSILIDAGESDDAEYILETLDALDIQKLDAVVATHPHEDHIGSMTAILREIPVDRFYMNQYSASTDVYEAMLGALQTSGSEVIAVTAGYVFDLGGIRFTALNPQDRMYDDANNSSIVLLAEYGNVRFLFEGDAEEEAIADMLTNYAGLMDADVLKVGHHGAQNGTTQEFLDVVTPDTAIINCGEDNDYGHPHQQTLDLLDAAGATVLRTDQNGDIAIFSDGEKVWYDTAA